MKLVAGKMNKSCREDKLCGYILKNKKWLAYLCLFLDNPVVH